MEYINEREEVAVDTHAIACIMACGGMCLVSGVAVLSAFATAASQL